jgi:hypothetical protein
MTYATTFKPEFGRDCQVVAESAIKSSRPSRKTALESHGFGLGTRKLLYGLVLGHPLIFVHLNGFLRFQGTGLAR